MSRLFRHLRLSFAILLLVVACTFLVACLVIRSLAEPPYIQIVDELPISTRLVRHELIRCGIDYCRLYEFSCSDTALRDKLVSKWRLRDLTGSNETPMSFMEYDHPDWWTPNVPAATHKFGRRDDDSESYLSLWEQSETGRLYVEVGRW